MIEITPHAEGAVLRVRAQPGARKNGVVGAHDGALKIAVMQAPEKGIANKAVAGVLAKLLGIKTAQVELIDGVRSREKRFLVHGLTQDELRGRLRVALA